MWAGVFYCFMKSERISAISINCPEFFARVDFQAWLNKGAKKRTLATWHGVGKPTEYSDTFIMHDGEDGSDYDDVFPEDIQQAIRLECLSRNFTQGIIRLTNLD